MLTAAGYKVTMEDDVACIHSVKDLLGKRSLIYKVQKAFNSDQLYHIPFITSTEADSIKNIVTSKESKAFIASTPKVVDINIIHCRYNHCSEHICKILMQHRKNKSTKSRTPPLHLNFCIACALCMNNGPYSRKTSYNQIFSPTLNMSEVEATSQLEPVVTPNNIEPIPQSPSQNTINNSSSQHLNSDNSAMLVTEVEVRTTKDNLTKAFTHMAMDAKTLPFTSIRGFKYANILMCVVTRYTFCFLHKTRDEILKDYTFWARYIFNTFGKFPATLRVDKAGENVSLEMKKFTNSCGTKLTATTTKQSNQNGHSENKIGHLFRSMKKLHTNSGVPLEYGCYGLAYATLVSNHTPNRAIQYDQPVNRAGFTAVHQLIRIYGCLFFYWLHKKTDADITGYPSIFLGFADLQRGYYCLDLERQTVVVSRYGAFRERTFPFLIANNGALLPIKTIRYPTVMEILRVHDRGGDKNDNEDPFIGPVPPSSPWMGIIKPHKASKLPFRSAQDTQHPTVTPSQPLDTTPMSIKDELDHKHNDSVNFQTEPTPKAYKHSSLTPLSTILSHGNLDPPKDEKTYEVERLLQRKPLKANKKDSQKQYLYQVKWKDSNELTWEPRESLFDCDILLQELFKKDNITTDLTVKELIFDDTNNEDDVTIANKEAVKLDLLNKVNTEAYIHKPIETLLDVQQNHTLRRSTRIKNNNTNMNYNDDDIFIECHGGPGKGNDRVTFDKHTLVEDYDEKGDQPSTSIKVPVFGNNLTKIDTDIIKIRMYEPQEEKANMMAEKMSNPPNFSEHIHFTKNNLNLDEIINYALTTINECINENFEEDGSNEKPPTSRPEMLGGKRLREFLKGELRELKSITEHKTMDVVLRPKGRTPITCRWVYDIKRNNENEITLFKARLVVHGFKQIEGVDFVKTFSSTAQMRSFRVVVMLAVAYDLDLTQYDISNAFLNGDLDEDIYMEFPPGYPGDSPDECLKLNKGLYGLKQASRIWNKRLISELNKAGLKVCKTEPGILHWEEGLKRCLVCLHVDDIIVGTNEDAMRRRVETVLKDPFLVKELGELHQYVGVRTTRIQNDDEKSIVLDQGPYGERSLRRYNFWNNPKNVNNPALSVKMSKVDIPLDHERKENKEEWEDFPYQSVVGSLMYACCATRPDLTQSVIQLARFMSNWGPQQVKAAKKLLHYWRSTVGDGIKFTKPLGNGKLDIYCFSDSDWAGCPDTRRSTIGFIIVICGGPVSWKSRMLKKLALSSCEAEYMALSEIGKEIIWLCNFFTEIGVEFNTPKIFCDSSSAINWAEDPIQHKRNKHVEMEFYYIRDLVERRLVDIYKINTLDNISDPFTKGVDTSTFQKMRPFMMGWKQVHITSKKARNPKQRDFINASLSLD